MSQRPELLHRILDVASVAAILAIGAYGVFVLPYSFPGKIPLHDSPSYAVGFNNSFAIGVLVLLIGVLLLRNLFWRSTPPEDVESIFSTSSSSAQGHHQSMPLAILLFFVVAYGVATCFIYAFMPPLDESLDGPMWIPRIRMALAYHIHPYRHFEFTYGPAMFYMPAFMIWLASIFEFDANFGYMTALHVSFTLGLCALFYVVNHFTISPGKRVLIFSMLALAGYDWSFNVAGTYFRYVTPFAIAIMMHKSANKHASSSDPRATLRLCGTAMLGALGVLFISLEFGFVYLLAQSAYCLHRCLFQNRRWGYALLATVACLPLWLVVFPRSLDRVFGGSRGFTSLPITPAIYIILYVLSLLWIVPILLRTCATLKPRKDAAFMLLWAMMLVGLLPASLGRCESLHCMKNGLGTFIVALPALAALRPGIFPIYSAAFALVFDVVWNVVIIVDNGQTLAPVRQALGGVWPQERPRTSQLVTALDLPSYPKDSIGLPMGIDQETVYWLIDSGRLSQQYYQALVYPFQGYGPLATMEDIQRKIAQLKNSSFLLVPKSILEFRGLTDAQITEARWKQQPALDRQQSIWLGTLFLLPVKFQTKHLTLNPMWEEARFIADNYEVHREALGYVLMKAK